MQMNIQELQTIKNFNLPVKIFIMNNEGYGLIKQTQETWLKGNHVGVDAKSGLGLPDFKKVSISYGLKSLKLTNQKSLHKNLKKILMLKEAVVCEIIVDPLYRVKPKIDSGKEIDDMSPLINRKEFLSNKVK